MLPDSWPYLLGQRGLASGSRNWPKLWILIVRGNETSAEGRDKKPWSLWLASSVNLCSGRKGSESEKLLQLKKKSALPRATREWTSIIFSMHSGFFFLHSKINKLLSLPSEYTQGPV